MASNVPLSEGNKQESESDIEAKRELRRDRRRRHREAKKRQKEEEKRVALQGAKDTKIKVVNADIINKVKSGSSSSEVRNSFKSEKIRFFEDEYPTLDEKPSVIFSSVPKKVHDSASEWETEDEIEEMNLNSSSANVNEIEKIPEIVSTEEINKSYSSILKSLAQSKKSSNPTKNELAQSKKTSNPWTAGVLKSHNPVINELSDDLVKAKNKVKKKDPITIDIFEAAKIKKGMNQKKNYAPIFFKLRILSAFTGLECKQTKLICHQGEGFVLFSEPRQNRVKKFT